ncbi:hypothetical protein E1091_13360 [Micromonospora fluostatini]|uniref:Peptidase n=1 Tax=Micromonospora fluostatini TaxID=1629071 RepID=A0ABY2DF58_9ACTN|nr:hypothetical protein E1091_13360 [Micromonospora fluostatini]
MTLLVAAGAPVPAAPAAPAVTTVPAAAPDPGRSGADPERPGTGQAGIEPVGRNRSPGAGADPSRQPAGPVTEVGIRLLDAPVSRRDDSRAHKYVVDHVRPGTIITRRIVVKNPSPITRDIALYAAAADVTGSGFYLAPDRTENELSSWIEVRPTTVTLKPDAERVAQVTIRVPPRASAGERYAVVWAEVAGVDGRNVRNIGRVGIRVYLSVGPGGEPPSSFQIGALRGEREPDGSPVVTADVRNTGRRALDLAGQLWLSDGPGGLSAGPVRAEAKTLAPGTGTTLRVVLDRRLPDGRWSARLELASGWTKGESDGTVTFGTVPPAASDEDDLAVPVLIGGLVASGLVLTLLAGYAYRRRGNRLSAALPAR